MNKFRLWHIPQIPGKPFLVDVAGPVEAAKLLDILARYDQFQFENNIKPDYCNVSGLEEFIDGEWMEWNDGEGNNIDEWATNLSVADET